ncbi:MAG: hypothetical protein HYT27_01935 [Parcubacteria group bacterium]|nr:hypothetical protein [Parcubacteria group bacterium]
MASNAFKFIEGGGQAPERENVQEELRLLENGYTHCTLKDKPRWCVFGEDNTGYSEVIYWIQPISNDEFVAQKLARLLSYVDNRHISAQMTEWNQNLKDEPVYRTKQSSLPGDETMGI